MAFNEPVVRVLHCFKCGVELRQATHGTDDRQPSGGTVFRAYGNYGSTVYDPGGSMLGSDRREWLEINICDNCLVNGPGRVLHVQGHTRRYEDTQLWVPPRPQQDERGQAMQWRDTDTLDVLDQESARQDPQEGNHELSQ